MSLDDDDIDALLDDALENYSTQEKAAQEQSKEVAQQRAKSAKLLDEALNGEQEQKLSAAADGGGLMSGGPEQMIQMLAQLSALAQCDPSAAGDGASAEEQEAKMLEMAKQLISGVAAATGEVGEKSQLNDALGQLTRVQELSKRHSQLASGAQQDPAEAQRVREELEAISKRLQSQATESAEQMKKAAQEAGVSVADAQKMALGSDTAAAGQNNMSPGDREKLDNFLKAMMVASMNSQTALNVPGSGAAAAAAANNSSNGRDQQAATAAAIDAQRAVMSQYYDELFTRFSSIDTQYIEYFAAGGAGNNEKASGQVTQDDWARFHEQHSQIQKLLKLKDRKADIFRASDKLRAMLDAGADPAKAEAEEDGCLSELNAVVEKLQSLGAPPNAFTV